MHGAHQLLLPIESEFGNEGIGPSERIRVDPFGASGIEKCDLRRLPDRAYVSDNGVAAQHSDPQHLFRHDIWLR